MNGFEERAQRLLAEDWLAGDAAVVERRAGRIRARRRRGAAALALVFVLVVVVGTTVAARSRTGPQLQVLSAEQRRLLDCATVLDGALTAVRVHVTMDTDATDDQVEAVRRTLVERRATDVEIHGRDEERQRWQDLHPGEASDVRFGPSVTASLAGVSPAEATDAAAAAGALAGVQDVQSAAERCRVTDAEQRSLLDSYARSRWRGGVDAIVFVSPPGASVDAVAEAVGTSPDVVRATFVNHESAFAEARCLFPDSPELDALRPDLVPVSFRLDLRGGPADARQFEERFADAADVRVVKAPSIDELLAGAGSMDVESYQALAPFDAEPNCAPAGEPVR